MVQVFNPNTWAIRQEDPCSESFPDYLLISCKVSSSSFHSFFLRHSPLCNVHTVYTKGTHRREDNEEGGILSVFLMDPGQHTGQAPSWTLRLLTAHRTSAKAPHSQPHAPRPSILQPALWSYPGDPRLCPPRVHNLLRPWPVQSSAMNMVLHLQLTIRSHRKWRSWGISSPSGHLGLICPTLSYLG